MPEYLDFEQPLRELDERIASLEPAARAALLSERARLERRLYATLTPIDRVRLARHPGRPQTLDYIAALIRDFVELHGDRRFGDDPAVVAGVGYFGKHRVAIVGQQRGRSTTERVARNFGRPNPEGYRKAARIYQLAERFGLPLLTFIDTQGAEPGLGAEERGQAEAIAHSLLVMAGLSVPVIATVIGEGGSGGALALGVANVLLMQEHACYAVITPEGCAAILWREASAANVATAAAALKLAAHDLVELGVADRIVAEPHGGAHRDPKGAALLLGRAIGRELRGLTKLTAAQVRAARAAKLAALGQAFLERTPARAAR